MSREEFVRKFSSRASGAVLDVLFRNATGGELSMLVRRMMQEFDAAFAAAYDELTTRPTPANGTHVSPAKHVGPTESTNRRSA